MPGPAPADTDKAVERELQRLRRLPENRVCPNCLKEDRMGFKGVCMAFKTFVCHDCKSAHQSFSHRTKSVDMSVWKMEEVRTLDERNGGGNRAAQRRWLARVPEGERPTEGSSLDAYKKFVERAYIEERYAAPAGGGELPAATAEAAGAAPARPRRSGKRRESRGRRATQPREEHGDAGAGFAWPLPPGGGDADGSSPGACAGGFGPQWPAAAPDAAAPDTAFGVAAAMNTQQPSRASRPSRRARGAGRSSGRGPEVADVHGLPEVLGSTADWAVRGGGGLQEAPGATFTHWAPSPAHSAPAAPSMSRDSSVANTSVVSPASAPARATSGLQPAHWIPHIDPTNPWAAELLKHREAVSGPSFQAAAPPIDPTNPWADALHGASAMGHLYHGG